MEAGTGEYEKVYTGELAVAENDYQYPKYNADGTPMNKKVPIEYAAGWMRQVRVQELVPETVEAVLLQAETGMTEEENADKLAKIFDVDDFCYLKGKAERVLRRHAKITPRTPGAGENAYSSIYTGVFDRGVREGERDVYGVSGVTPGEKAEKNGVWFAGPDDCGAENKRWNLNDSGRRGSLPFWIFIIPIHISAMAVWTRCKSLRIRLNLRYMQEF